MLAFFLMNLTSSLWEEKIIERGKKEEQTNEMLRTKLHWEWEGGGGGRLLTVGSHICIKQPDTSGVISQHTETKNNNCCERDGPNERRSFALHNKAEHFQRRVTFGTCSVIFFDCLYHQIPVYNVPWDLKTSICAPKKANVKPSVGVDGWKGKVETARCFMLASLCISLFLSV